VTSYEINPDVSGCARSPWSPAHGPSLKVIAGDISAAIRGLADVSFDAILHDPPRFGLAGELYSQVFYDELGRVLKPRGRLFHYTGTPNRLTSGRDVPHEVERRLRFAGFTTRIEGDGVSPCAVNHASDRDLSGRSEASPGRGTRGAGHHGAGADVSRRAVQCDARGFYELHLRLRTAVASCICASAAHTPAMLHSQVRRLHWRMVRCPPRLHGQHGDEGGGLTPKQVITQVREGVQESFARLGEQVPPVDTEDRSGDRGACRARPLHAQLRYVRQVAA
jgi:hypothetical protein